MKKNAKRLLSLLLALLLVLSLTACGESGGSKSDLPEELQQYLSPWEKDAIAEAKEKGTMEFYFMATLGMRMSESTEDDPYKWGDCCLIVFPDGTTMLVDGGMPAYAPVMLENLKRLGVEKLDYVVLSHQHGDHTGGLICEGGVFDSVEVGKVYYNGLINSDWKNPMAFEEALDESGIPHEHLFRGETLSIGGVNIEVLWPDNTEVAGTYYDVKPMNNRSIVLRFDYEEFSALFTGDLYKESERQLIDIYGDKLNVDLLKIPHHGHDTSSSSEFGAAVTPEIAVATGYVGMATTNYYSYTKQGARVMFDYMDGYIHVSAAKDGAMEWDKSLERTSDLYAGLDKNAGITW